MYVDARSQVRLHKGAALPVSSSHAVELCLFTGRPATCNLTLLRPEFTTTCVDETWPCQHHFVLQAAPISQDQQLYTASVPNFLRFVMLLCDDSASMSLAAMGEGHAIQQQLLCLLFSWFQTGRARATLEMRWGGQLLFCIARLGCKQRKSPARPASGIGLGWALVIRP